MSSDLANIVRTNFLQVNWCNTCVAVGGIYIRPDNSFVRVTKYGDSAVQNSGDFDSVVYFDTEDGCSGTTHDATVIDDWCLTCLNRLPHENLGILGREALKYGSVSPHIKAHLPDLTMEQAIRYMYEGDPTPEYQRGLLFMLIAENCLVVRGAIAFGTADAIRSCNGVRALQFFCVGTLLTQADVLALKFFLGKVHQGTGTQRVSCLVTAVKYLRLQYGLTLPEANFIARWFRDSPLAPS